MSRRKMLVSHMTTTPMGIRSSARGNRYSCRWSHNQSAPKTSISPAPSSPEHSLAITTEKAWLLILKATGSARRSGTNGCSEVFTNANVRSLEGFHSASAELFNKTDAMAAAAAYTQTVRVAPANFSQERAGTNASAASTTTAAPRASQTAAARLVLWPDDVAAKSDRERRIQTPSATTCMVRTPQRTGVVLSSSKRRSNVPLEVA